MADPEVVEPEVVEPEVEDAELEFSSGGEVPPARGGWDEIPPTEGADVGIGLLELDPDNCSEFVSLPMG